MRSLPATIQPNHFQRSTRGYSNNNNNNNLFAIFFLRICSFLLFSHFVVVRTYTFWLNAIKSAAAAAAAAIFQILFTVLHYISVLAHYKLQITNSVRNAFIVAFIWLENHILNFNLYLRGSSVPAHFCIRLLMDGDTHCVRINNNSWKKWNTLKRVKERESESDK